MRLIKARYRNFCQHLDRVFEFPPGLSCIRGPIGSGKSNLLTGIVGALTNDFGRNPGVKLDNIYQLAKRGEPSFVELTAEHHNTIFTIKRGLKPSGQELTIGQNVFTKDAEIKVELEKILGVSAAVISDYTFIKQWGIFDFLLDTDADRAKAFQQLFGTAVAEKIYKELGDVSCEVPPPPVDGDLARARLAEREAELNKTLAALVAYTHLPGQWVEVQDPDSLLIRSFEKRQQLVSQIDQHSRERERLGAELEPLAAALAKITSEFEAVKALVAETKPLAEEARKVLALWPAYRVAQSMLLRAQQTLTRLDAAAKQNVEPVKPADYLAGDATTNPVLAAYAENLSRWQQLDRTLQTLQKFKASPSLVECPTCGTPAATLDCRAAEFRQEATKLQGLMKGTYERIGTSKAYDQALAVYQGRQKADTSARLLAIEQQQAAAATLKPAREEAELQEVIDDQAIYEKGLANLQAEMSQKAQAANRLQGRCGQLDTQWAELSAEFVVLPEIAAEAVATAQARLQKIRVDLEARNRLRMQQGMLERAVAEDRAAVQSFEDWKANSRKLEACKQHLQSVREIFHHTNLPEKVAQSYLQEMREAINDNLEAFDLPFRVQVLPGLKFEATFPNGVKQPANRLSGGQKVLFALAFRIVVNSIFARDLGLLCLDEPTAGLDEDSLACLDTAMSRLRGMAKTSGLQVLLVTHDRGRDSLYDRVFDLAAG